MINAAIYGIGRWGSTLVRSVQGKSEKIRFTTGITRTPASCTEIASEFDITLTDDYAAVLADPAIDAVVLASPPWLHLQQAGQAAGAGKPVFVEKPLALIASEAAAVVAACNDAGVPLAVGFNRRFLPAFIEMLQRIKTGQIGTLLHVEGQFSGPTFLRTPPDIWRAKREFNPAGGMAPRGLHVLDLMIAICGKVDSVFAQSDSRATALDLDDTTSMLFRFQQGATGYLSTLMATGEFWRLQAHGTQGWIEMDSPTSLVISNLDEVTERKTFEPMDIERAELDAFADMVTAAKPFLVPADDAAHGIAVLGAIVQSAKTGLPVPVSDQ